MTPGKPAGQAVYGGGICRDGRRVYHRYAGKHQRAVPRRKGPVCALSGVAFEHLLERKPIHLCHERADRKIVGDLPVDKAAAKRWTFLLAAIFTAASYGVAWALHLMGLI